MKAADVLSRLGLVKQLNGIYIIPKMKKQPQPATPEFQQLFKKMVNSNG